jgi:hypothetical protein
MADIKTLVEEAKRLFGLSAPFDHQQREFDAALDALAEAHQAEVARLTRERDAALLSASNSAINTNANAELALRAEEEVARLTRENEGLAKDAARLDWLDTQKTAYGFQDLHEGNEWGCSGAYATIRDCIDAALADASGAQEGERT